MLLFPVMGGSLNNVFLQPPVPLYLNFLKLNLIKPRLIETLEPLFEIFFSELRG